MADDDLEQRVEALEQRLAATEDELDRYREQHALLLTEVDIKALDDPSCPECGTGSLTRDSGLSWAKAVCHDCGATWVIKG